MLFDVPEILEFILVFLRKQEGLEADPNWHILTKQTEVQINRITGEKFKRQKEIKKMRQITQAALAIKR